MTAVANYSPAGRVVHLGFAAGHAGTRHPPLLNDDLLGLPWAHAGPTLDLRWEIHEGAGPTLLLVIPMQILPAMTV